MHSTWLDNDHLQDNSKYRIESASKKHPTNRIQVYVQLNNRVSKITPSQQRNIPPPPIFTSQNKIDPLNQTSGSTTLQFRRVNTTDGVSLDRSQSDRNLLKLMQQQLQLAKKMYEEKIRQLLKENSIQISKLKIKIQNNNQLILSKDGLIAHLQEELRKKEVGTAGGGGGGIDGDKCSIGNVVQKVADVQAKFGVFMDVQNKLGKKVNQINTKIEMVEKGLLSILACKLANLQSKISQFAELCSQKISNIQLTLLTKLKKQQPPKPLPLSQPQSLQPQPYQSIDQMPQLTQKLETLKKQINLFKTKQFRYENSSINLLQRDVGMLQAAITELEMKFRGSYSRLRNSKVSSKKNYQKFSGSAQNSCYFDDYQEVYDEIDSLGEDQFFHPLQQSARKFTQKQPSKTPQKPPTSTKPTHNDSFQNFTSDEQDDETPNQKRLLHTLRTNGYKLPLAIEIDLTGYIRKKSDQKYLIDGEKKGFMLSQGELNFCRNRGWIVW